ncbi:T9SS sorting signal type C domain-containing protein [Flavobacterium ardleyense]|uniref:T9SS sorting signal type C domain-containing protein n=1 Tax=Flavobacterium ardleyense TaxID=2038737 RepID=UPI00298C45CB|nr:T9SS sorting signal type C domain-containing protein [Flavobacterium ardleyense]
MIKSLLSKFALLFCLSFIMTLTESYAQQTVFTETFSTAQSSAYTTNGAIGTSNWTVARSGQDFGARISGGILTLTNDATSAGNPTGWISATTNVSNFDNAYNPILSQNAGIVSWTFNMRQIRTNPRGFEFGQYGVAFILAGTLGSNVATGKGWALVLGNYGTTDAIRLVAYSNGLKTFSTKLSSKASGYTDFGREYTSARVEYNPADNRWSLYLRKDGSTFQNPKSGTLIFQETWIHTDYVNEPLTIMGGYWSAATTKNQTAFFDNISVSVQTPEIISIDPDSKIAGSSSFTMTVDGTGFLPSSKVQWNGQERPTTYVSSTTLTAVIPASDLVLSGNANVQVKNNTVLSNIVVFDIEPSGAPTLTLSKNSLPAFSTIQGTASSSETYTITGNNLESGATLTAPASFEMSVGSSITYSNPLVLQNNGGGLIGQPLTINVRVKAAATAGVYTGNITNAATGAVTKLVAVSGKVLALEPTTAATAINFTNVTSTTLTVNWTNGNGSNRIVLIKEASAVNALPVDGTNYTANGIIGIGSELGVGNFVVYKGAANSVNVTGLNPNTVYHVSVIEFNGPANAENYRSVHAPGNVTTANSPAGLQVKVANTSYKIDFDTTVDGVNLGEFQGAGIAKIAEPGQLDSDSWAFTGFEGGVINFGGNSPEDSSYEMGASDGDVDESGIYAFNVSSTATDNYTLGIKPGGSDFNPGTVTLRLHNRTGATITSLNIGYKIYIKNVENSSTKISFSHKLESASNFINAIAEIDVISDASIDLNPTWKASYRVVTLTGLNIPSDKYYNLRWSGSTATATAVQDEFGIDDIEVIANTSTNTVAFDGIAEDFVLQGNANLSADLSVQNRLQFNGGKLSIKDKTLTIAGKVENTIANGLVGGFDSKLVVRGTQNPSLSFDTAANTLQSFSLIGANPNTVTALNNFSVSNLLSVDEQQILNLGTNTVNGNLTSIQNNGIIRTQNVTATPFASGKTWGGTGILNMNATSTDQTLVAGTYNNLTLSSTAGTTAVANLTVNGKLDLPKPNASATQGSLSMAGFTLTMGPDGINTGIGDVTGIIKRDVFAPNKTYTFGHPNSSITFPPAGTLPTSMSAKLTIGTAPTWKAGTILRQFDIIHTGAINTKAIIRQHYLDSELNGNAESRLAFWAHTISPLNTFDQGRSNNNTTDNWVEISNANVGLYFKNTFGQVFITLDEGADSDLTWNGSESTSWITAVNWTPKGVPSATTKVLIPNVSTGSNRYPIIDATSSVKTITIDAGAVVNTPDNSVLTVYDGAGAWQNNGIFNPGNGTVLFNNIDATISGSTSFNNLTIATGAGLRALEGNYMSIAGTFTNNGTMFTTLTPNTIEFKGTNQIIPAPGGLEFGGYHHLKVTGTGAIIAPTTLNVRGNLTINQPINFTAKTINLAGISNQTIAGTAAINFSNLIVNKETGAVILAKDISVGGTLTLTKGNVVLGANNLTLGSTAVAGTFGTNTMIVADGIGLVRRPVTAIGSYFFPIGELAGAPSYAPITVNVTAGSFSSAFIAVNLKDIKHPNNNSSQNYLRKYWSVTQNGITGAVATITGKYDAVDVLGVEAEIAAAQFNGAFNVVSNPWIKFGTLSNNTIVATNATLTAGQASVFTGIKAGVFSVEVFGYGEFCKGSDAFLTAEVVGGDAPFTYTWSNGLANSQIVQVPTNIDGETNYTLTVRDANGFVAVDNTNPVKILPLTVPGTVVSQQICAATSPADVLLSGSVGKVLYWQRSQTSDFNVFTNISNFTTTLTGAEVGQLNQTTYFRAVVESGNCGQQVSNTATIEIKSTTWDGNNWSDGIPTANTSAIFTGAFTATASIEACSIVVNNNAAVTIRATFDVTLNGALTVESGSFKMESNTNLIQLTDVQNSGNIIVERESSKLYRSDYTMWGSPVTGAQTLKQFSPLTVVTRFYTYNTSTDQFNTIVPETNTFASGKGYLIRMPDNHTIFGTTVQATSWTGIFTGKPTNGTVPVELAQTLNGFNMLSNPYPSMISADAFLTENSSSIDGTLYFWRRRNAVQDASAYYATYTLAGGAGTAGSASAPSQVPNGFIQVGQGFIAKAKSSGAVFTNSMRTKLNNDNQFFKNANSQDRSRIWLNVSNTAGEFGQTLVAYMPQAENELDRTDGKYLGDGSTALTSWLDNSEYIIQGRAPFVSSDVVALNFKTATAGSYTIAIDHVDGLFEGSQDIFLRDNSVGVLHDLKNAAYTFATEAGSFNTRFDIVYLNPLSVSNPNFDSNSVVLYKKQNNVVINSGMTTLENVEVYDIRGRLLAIAKSINSNEVSINVGETNQVLIVKITSIDGAKVTKKTIN